MVEWRRVCFADTFEVLQRIVDRLNRMSKQLDVLGRAGLEAADARYELIYRDYLMQRFHRVEAGTVKMTTNLNVDLRELFVMPRALPRKRDANESEASIDALMDLSAARQRIKHASKPFGTRNQEKEKKPSFPAVDLLQRKQRWVIVGTPGSGKSTFFEWLQIQLAVVEVELALEGKQAIPLLLRVRQLDPNHLPAGAELIAAATASGDRAKLAPPGWMQRMMERGRVVFMLDGLDEIEPALLRDQLLPWLAGIVHQYPRCRYLISSRPSGYPTGTLSPLKFVEADLLDFDTEAIAEYTRHWVSRCGSPATSRSRKHGERERRTESRSSAAFATTPTSTIWRAAP
jgi:predicted NACHT family NTPase